MRRLPALIAESHAWGLPLADRSAAALAQHLLGISRSAGRGQPEQCLAQDPPLLLWSVCLAWQAQGFRPRSLASLFDWLVENTLSVLRWAESDADVFPAGVDPSELTRQVADDLLTSEWAAAQATQAGAHGEIVEESKLLGILSGGAAWMQLVSPDADPAAILPDWLAVPQSSPALDHVKEAQNILNRGEQDDASDVDIQSQSEWAEESARQWLAEASDLPPLLPRITEKLGRLADLEDRFAETLEREKLESLAEFAAGAGHEINNPLAIIGGRSQLLLRDEESPERQRELALIVAQVRRANEMIADMRLFSRPPEPEPESFDLAELVNQTVAEFADQAAERAVEFIRTGEIHSVRIEADPVQIAVVLHAVCRNAIEAIGREGVVEISLRRTPRGVEVLVTDDGPGLSPEERRHLFDPFYSARQAGRGLGFGLSKAWRIVTNHGGRIEVASEPGEGAVFVVKLPRQIAH